MIGKLKTLELLAPIIPAIPSWFLGGMEEYNKTFDDKQKTYGSGLRSLYVQRAAVHRMKIDPAVRGSFRPADLDRRDSLLLEGEPGSDGLCLLFNKAEVFGGRLRSCRNPHSQRDSERLGGNLAFDGFSTIPIGCFYVIRRPDNLLAPAIESVGIGEETHSGYEWAHTIWSAAGGMTSSVLDGQPPLPNLPIPEIRLRRPDTMAEPGRVGIREQEQERKANDDRIRRQSDLDTNRA